METAYADQIVAWTARGSVACYLTWSVTAILRAGESDRFRRVAFGTYLAGLILMFLHVVAAFAFVHGWSHAHAYEHTARQTDEVVGIDWGGGLYFNYLLLAIWGADVLRVCRARRSETRPPRWWTAFVHVYLIFLFVNATVVFGPRGWKWVAFGFGLMLAAAYRLRGTGANRSQLGA